MNLKDVPDFFICLLLVILPSLLIFSFINYNRKKDNKDVLYTFDRKGHTDKMHQPEVLSLGTIANLSGTLNNLTP